MALDTFAVVEAGIEDVFDSIQLAKPYGSDARRGYHAVMELQAAFISAYIPKFQLTITDTGDADVAAFVAGEGSDLRVGDVFKTLGTGDWTDNGLVALKGGALAANDVWQLSAAATVIYLGNTAFTFTGETESDW